MPSSKNKVIIACAGSGKTTRLVEEALNLRHRRIAIITYTNNNARQIAKRFGELNSGVPKHVEVMTWFEFLLRECARPYQRAKYPEKRIESLAFVNQRSAKGIPESKTCLYYFANGEAIYSDKISQFVVECESKTEGAVTDRLGAIYTDVFIDEFQDLAGWDHEVITMLLESGICVTLVGDPRQHIYSTNPSPKNSQYLGVKVVELVRKWERRGLCTLETMSNTHRCNQAICDFANALWPAMEKITSKMNDATDHEGVFLVAENAVEDYIRRFAPQVLRHDKRARTYGRDALNFGLAKGLQFDRVLIVPTEPIKKYLQGGMLGHVEKLYVAVTRAKHSVAFVFAGESTIASGRWPPSAGGLVG